MRAERARRWAGELRSRYRRTPSRRAPAGIAWLARLHATSSVLAQFSPHVSNGVHHTAIWRAVNHWHVWMPLALRQAGLFAAPAGTAARRAATIDSPLSRPATQELVFDERRNITTTETRSLRRETSAIQRAFSQRAYLNSTLTLLEARERRSRTLSVRKSEWQELQRALRENFKRTEDRRYTTSIVDLTPPRRTAPITATTVAAQPAAQHFDEARAAAPASSTGSPSTPAASAPLTIDVNAITDSVMRQIDRRLVAQRERMGRS
jgi:hypothetical protein